MILDAIRILKTARRENWPLAKLRRVLREYLDPAVIFRQPAGITPDPSALFGLQAVIQNVNNYSESPYTIVSSQVVANVLTLTAFQTLIGEIIIPNTVGISGAFTIQLPSTAALVAQMGANTIPLDGTYAEPMHISNSSGQTGTVTAGDANTTISGTATVATAVTRKYLAGIPAATSVNAATVLLTNMGFWTYP